MAGWPHLLVPVYFWLEQGGCGRCRSDLISISGSAGSAEKETGCVKPGHRWEGEGGWWSLNKCAGRVQCSTLSFCLWRQHPVRGQVQGLVTPPAVQLLANVSGKAAEGGQHPRGGGVEEKRDRASQRGPGPGSTQELYLVLRKFTWAQTLGIQSCFPRHVSRELGAKGGLVQMPVWQAEGDQDQQTLGSLRPRLKCQLPRLSP